MHKALLYIAGGINLAIGSLLLLITLVFGYGFEFEIVPLVIFLGTGAVFTYAASQDNLNYSFNKFVLISAILNVFTCNIISFILGIIGYAYLPGNIENNDVRKVKKELSAEEKETRKMRNILALGVGLVVIAGIVFATSTWDTLSGSAKTIILVCSAVLFFLVSFLAENKLNLKVSGMMYYVLSNVLLAVSILAAGYFEIFGNWFSLNGAGSNLFSTVLWIVIGALSVLAYYKYKNKRILYLTYLSLMSVIYFGILATGLTGDFSILALCVILAIGALYKKTDVFCNFSKIALSFLSAILFANIINGEDNTVISLISFIVLAVSQYYLAMVENNEFYKVFAPLSTVINAIAISLIGETKSEVLLLQIALIALGVYAIGYYKRNDKLISNVSSAIANLTWLYVVIDSLDLGFYYLAVVTAIVMLGVSVIVSLDKNSGKYHYEKVIEPIKVFILILTVCRLMESLGLVGTIAIELIFLVTFFAMYLIRRGTFKFVYFVLTCFVALWTLIAFRDEFAPVTQIANSVVILGLLLTTFLSKDRKYINFKEGLYVGLLLSIFSIFTGFTGKYENLELICATGILICYAIAFLLVRKDSILKLITTLAILIPYYITLNSVVDMTMNSDNFVFVRNMEHVFGSIPWLVMIIVYTRGFLESIELKYIKIIEIVALSIWYINVLWRVCPETGIFVGIVALISILAGYKTEKYVAFYYTGIVFTVINLLTQLKDVWNLIPVWAYILIAGLVLIGIVTYKEYSKTNTKCEKVVPDIIEPNATAVKKTQVDSRAIIVGSIIYFGILVFVVIQAI